MTDKDKGNYRQKNTKNSLFSKKSKNRHFPRLRKMGCIIRNRVLV